MPWPASLPSLSPGDVLTAADVDAIVDALDVVGGEWDAYTPSWTGSTTDPTLGSSVVTGRYRLCGKTVDVHISVTIGTGFSAGSGGYIFSLPPGCSILNNGASEALGTGSARDVSAPAARGFVVYYLSGTTVAAFKPDDGAILGSATPFTWATGDRITLHMSSLEIV